MCENICQRPTSNTLERLPGRSWKRKGSMKWVKRMNETRYRQIHIQQGGLAEMVRMYYDMKGMARSHLSPETQKQESKQTEKKNIS